MLIRRLHESCELDRTVSGSHMLNYTVRPSKRLHDLHCNRPRSGTRPTQERRHPGPTRQISDPNRPLHTPDQPKHTQNQKTTKTARVRHEPFGAPVSSLRPGAHPR